MKKTSLKRASHGNPVAAGTLAFLLVLCGRADSSTLIQITPDNPGTTEITNPGQGLVVLSSGWNVLSPLSSGTLEDYGVASLLDSTGFPTGISLAADDTNVFRGYNSDGSTVASPGFPADVKRESFFGNTEVFNGIARPTATWVFGGFDPDDDLIFTFFASRMGVADPVTDNREGKYEVVGATTTSTLLNASNNDSNTASVTVKADIDGNVVLNMTEGPNNNNGFGFFYLNAMSIEIVPEPSSAILVLVAGLSLCVVRRRR